MKYPALFGLIGLSVFLFSGCTTSNVEVDNSHNPYTQEEAKNFDGILVEDFSDVQCGHCITLRPILNELKEKYPQAEFRSYPFPFIGTQSFASAIAIECAKMQNLIIGGEFENAVFATPKLSTNAREEIAESLGLDMEEYESCTSSKSSDSIVQASLTEGKARKVNSTPTLFINGERFEGQRSVEKISEKIESLQ